MLEFAEGSDPIAGRRLARSLQGPGAFRRFKDEVHGRGPSFYLRGQTFRDVRARKRAVDWLRDMGLVSDAAAWEFLKRFQTRCCRANWTGRLEAPR
jgi:hypothetical protein